MALTQSSCNKAFGGEQKVFKHYSSVLKCDMNFGVYIPPQAASEKVPVFYWLSGLTCTEQNFVTKAGAQRYAAEHGVMIVAPDTSPRGCNIEGEDDSWDFGSGAGFYVDATEEKWKTNYNMYSYITKELPELINANFPADPEIKSISGHSMGGHGALMCALRNPGLYRCASAFAPICNPIHCPWGEKAFSGYLGSNKDAWKEYDSCELVKKYQGPPLKILIDQGLADTFYPHQLLPENFVQACSNNNLVSVTLRKHEGYDHSYYFVSSFIGDHIAFHTKC
ncbi:predicted protein [Nematostella vectensis]|uniref:S-formylglutathione hydrolase n=2 Tax=Nematostella vectensis TaxID=45351 RepID=A7S5U3_NEMVE|nr:predicted protein [Nematostella vectensis]|eukprot:XP_001633029.1 predicted protein [Nematostella vectensis]